MEIPSVRVLVVGDSGVGKTALLGALCREPAGLPGAAPSLLSHRWTTGCDAHVFVRLTCWNWHQDWHVGLWTRS